MKVLQKYLEPEEVRAMINALEDGYNTKRNQTIVWTMYTTGLRVSELVSLNKEDIVKQGHVVHNFIIKGKGNKQRVIYLNALTREILKKYLKTNKIPGALFTHSKGKRLSRFAIYKIIKTAGIKAGLGAEIGPNNLRHSYAMRLMKNDVPIRMIQDLLGHEHINTTMLSLTTDMPDTGVDNGELKDRLNNVEF